MKFKFWKKEQPKPKSLKEELYNHFKNNLGIGKYEFGITIDNHKINIEIYIEKNYIGIYFCNMTLHEPHLPTRYHEINGGILLRLNENRETILKMLLEKKK